MYCRKIRAEGSVLQELCHFVILTMMFSIVLIDSPYFVKSTPPRAFSVSFKYFAGMYRHIEDVHEDV